MIRVMKYGVRNITEGRDRALQEMRAAHNYYNTLVELYREEKDRMDAIMRKYSPEIELLDSELEVVNDKLEQVFFQIRLDRKAASSVGKKIVPKKLGPTEEQHAQVEVLKAERSRLWAARKKVVAEYVKLVQPARRNYKARSGNTDVETLDRIAWVTKWIRDAKKKTATANERAAVPSYTHELILLKNRVKKAAPPPRGKCGREERNQQVAEEMLGEDWCEAWKEEMRTVMEINRRFKQARAESGLRDATYDNVEQSVKRAFDDATKHGTPVKFQRFDGGKKIGARVRNGMSIADAMSCRKSMLKILDQTKPSKAVRATGRRAVSEYVLVSFPVGKQDEIAYITCEVKLHRPIPDDAMIKYVYLVPKRVGLSVSYSIQFTVDVPKPLTEHRSKSDEICNVELGWSSFGRGIRVAVAANEPVVLDGLKKTSGKYGAISGMLFARRLRGAADAYFEGPNDAPQLGARTALVEWLKENPACAESHVWLKEMTATIGKWRSHGKLALVAMKWVDEIGRDRVQSLWKSWKSARLATDADLYEQDRSVFNQWLSEHGVVGEFERMGVWLEWWRRKDAHLVQWAANTDRKARANRRQQYKYAAAELARTYAFCNVKKIELSKLAQRKETGEDFDELRQRERYRRTVAAPYEFKEALKAAFGSDRYVEVRDLSQTTS